MSELLTLLCESIQRRSRDHRVAVLLSAGVDSLSTTIALRELGKQIQAYTYEVDGYRSFEQEKVEAIAAHFGWPLKLVRVPALNLADDFKRLAILHKCRKKVQFEVLFKFLYVMPEIEEREEGGYSLVDPLFAEWVGRLNNLALSSGSGSVDMGIEPGL